MNRVLIAHQFFPLQVMIQRLNSTGHLYSTCSEVGIEQHNSCTCGCRISEGDCSSNQVDQNFAWP